MVDHSDTHVHLEAVVFTIVDCFFIKNIDQMIARIYNRDKLNSSGFTRNLNLLHTIAAMSFVFHGGQ